MSSPLQTAYCLHHPKSKNETSLYRKTQRPGSCDAAGQRPCSKNSNLEKVVSQMGTTRDTEARQKWYQGTGVDIGRRAGSVIVTGRRLAPATQFRGQGLESFRTLGQTRRQLSDTVSARLAAAASPGTQHVVTQACICRELSHGKRSLLERAAYPVIVFVPHTLPG